MNDKLTKDLISRLNYIEQRANEALATHITNKYGSNMIDSAPFYGFRSAALSFLKSTFGENNIYYSEFDSNTQRSGYSELLSAIEILRSLRTEIENNWLSSFKGLISAEIFTDFFEMAEYLLKNGYKDAAAVIVGSVLEEHLRQLATNNNIAITYEKDGDSIPKKADRINSDLASSVIYNKLDQKNITAWLDLRNKAAHGNYADYEISQVEIMYFGVSDFISRNQI